MRSLEADFSFQFRSVCQPREFQLAQCRCLHFVGRFANGWRDLCPQPSVLTQVLRILTATKLDIMLHNRAADVATGSRDTLETRPSENRCACEVNMLPVQPIPQSIRLRNPWEVHKCFWSALVLLATLVPC